jgi:cholesterol 24(S)-hydroxylase
MCMLDLSPVSWTIAAALGLSLLLYTWWHSMTKEYVLPLPPCANASLFENIRAFMVQKSLYQLERGLNFALQVKQGAFGSSAMGATFCLRAPLLRPWIVTTDYMLARAILAGSSELGIAEGERSVLSHVMNFLDRNECNIMTSLTSDKHRNQARKHIMPAFSTLNLMRTWPKTKEILEEEFQILRALTEENNVIDLKSVVLRIFLRTLSRSTFGVEFTYDGTESAHSINGLEYLQALDAVVRESAREFSIPFRRYMFWEEGVQRSVQAMGTLRCAVEKIQCIYKEQQSAKCSTDNVPHSVLDHIMQHAYPKEITRKADVLMFSLASMETTAYSLCFLVMELARNPEAKAKLQWELAQFMPARASISEGLCMSCDTESEGDGDGAAADKELVSNIHGCDFLLHCIRESMRLFPVAGDGPGRDLTQDIQYCGMRLPRGSLVQFHLYAMFRERWIDRPDDFLPERWAEGNPQLSQLKAMFIPFGLGHRSCMGQNMAMFQLKLVAAHFLHCFDFTLVGEPSFEFFLTLKPDQLQMRVTPRVV